MIFAMLNSFADLLWALQVVLLIVFVFSLIFLNVPGLEIALTRMDVLGSGRSFRLSRCNSVRATEFTT